MLALVRPDSWNFPLFLHVLGAGVLVGAVGATVVIATRAPALRRLLVRTIGFLVIPAWVLMRFAGPHAGPLCHLLDACPVRGAEDQLVGALVIEVDEAGLGAESVRHLACHQSQHLFEVQRRVHRGDRFGEKAQVTCSYVHQRS